MTGLKPLQTGYFSTFWALYYSYVFKLVYGWLFAKIETDLNLFPAWEKKRDMGEISCLIVPLSNLFDDCQQFQAGNKLEQHGQK